VDLEVKTFDNKEFQVEAIEEAGCTLSVKIIVKPERAQKGYQKAVKEVNKRISIPGFRKGRAPDRTVISRYSSYVEQEWKEILVNDAYHAAVELTTIYPLNKESIHRPRIESCSKEEGAIVRLSYEHYPHLPPITLSDITIPSTAQEPIPQERIDEIIEEVRRSYADWEDVTDRSIQEGDFVDVSIDSLEEEPPRPLVKDRRFEVTDKRLAQWLKKLVIGLSIGESVEGVSELEEESDPQVKKNFKPTKVRLTLHAIKKILLPEVDDELAKKIGAISLEDLKSKIVRNLEQREEEVRRMKQIEALEEALLTKYHFDLPASIVISERKERMARRIQTLREEDLSDEEIKAREEEIQREVSNEIDRSLRLYFLNKQIAKQGKISLTNEELNEALVNYLTQNPNEQETADTRDFVSRMASALLQRKTKEYALTQVQMA
jgi:trigger factor